MTSSEPVSLVITRSSLPTAPPDVPVACRNAPPTDEPITAVTASTPDAALAAFLNTARARTLLLLGYAQIAVDDTGSYRYERRNDQGDLITIIDVTPDGDKWRATRLQASPC